MKTTGEQSSFFGLTFISTGKETNGKYFQSLTSVPAGDEGPPPHIHNHEDEGFYIMSGTLVFQVDDEEVTLHAGEYILIEKGEVHTWKNPFQTDVQMMVTFAPAGIEGMFIALDETMKFGSADFLQDMVNIGRKYGTEFLVGR